MAKTDLFLAWTACGDGRLAIQLRMGPFGTFGDNRRFERIDRQQKSRNSNLFGNWNQRSKLPDSIFFCRSYGIYRIIPRDRELVWRIVQLDFQIRQFVSDLNIYGVLWKRGAFHHIANESRF